MPLDNSSCKQSLAIVLPSLDPDNKFDRVVEELVNTGFSHIVIVDDGTGPEGQTHFEKAAALPGCTVLHHEGNKGKGRALKTAFRHVLDELPDVKGVITIDGDGQHLTKDIIACGERMLKEGNKVILGCRDFDQPAFRPEAWPEIRPLPGCSACSMASASRIPRPDCALFRGIFWRILSGSKASALNMRPTCS